MIANTQHFHVSVLSGIFCRNPVFWRFVGERFGKTVSSETECAEFVRNICGVKSRSELDENNDAANIFHERLRKPFVKFNASL